MSILHVNSTIIIICLRYNNNLMLVTVYSRSMNIFFDRNYISRVMNIIILIIILLYYFFFIYIPAVEIV